MAGAARGKRRMKMNGKINCEFCGNYVYDEDYGCYICEMDLDEDEMARFMTGTFHDCPYFQYGDEYRIVKKQM